MKKNTSYSRISLAIIFAFILSISFYFNLWKENRIKVDAPSYYTYLPATFIYHDLHLNFIDKNPSFFQDKIWYYTIENHQRLIKHPMGVSLALSPFFLIGHVTAMTLGSAEDGYSLPYQNAMSIGVLVYLFIGLFFLRKLLLEFFSEKITALTLFATVIGTNLLWYSTFEGLMPHAVSFSFWCMSLYAFYSWLKTENKKYLFLFAIAFGFIVLIRPLSLVGILFFIIYGIFTKGGVRNFASFLKPKLKTILLASLCSITIASLQFFYWKYATGKWIYDVYIDEHFIFDSPQMIPFLFSWRKGLFIYTPILLFAIVGLFSLYKTNKGFFFGTIITLTITIYILSSWWAWSYGICWGMRPMIDYYSILSIPLAAGIQLGLENKKWLRYLFLTLNFALITLNLFQSWQYKNGLIHYDDMTKEAYFKGFFQTKASREWRDCLKPYDWDRRIKGLPQIEYSQKLIDGLSENDEIYLRGSNLLYVSVNAKAQNVVASYFNNVTVNELFTFEHQPDGTVCIKASSGYYLTDIKTFKDIIAAAAGTTNKAEKFKIEYLVDGDNKIALKASNGKYLSMSPDFPFVLYATATSVGDNETFRLTIFDK